jgi:hypothetical protein
MTKRRIEKRIEELEHAGDDGGGILILSKDDDGTVTNVDGEPVTDEMCENATVVVDYVSKGVVETWPDVDDDGDIETTQS